VVAALGGAAGRVHGQNIAGFVGVEVRGQRRVSDRPVLLPLQRVLGLADVCWFAVN
jgi:hypothetical protein